MASLYLHFPFCETKCHYCDFYSIGREKTQPEMPLHFKNAIEKEIQLYPLAKDFVFDTVFLGGGTPSMTPPHEMEEIFETLRKHFQISKDAEITMEANPSSVNQENLEKYQDLGVNRISMGVQSLNNEHLKILGRVHDRDQARSALDSIFASGLRNVSVDLLCGVPGQTTDDLKQFFDELASYPITHLSCYLLTLPPHHKLFPKLPDEDSQLEHLLFIDQALKSLGFEHYEISNFAKPGFQARHNLAYWTGDTYFGLGPSAHSYDVAQKKRWKNVSSLRRFHALLSQGESPIEWEEHLNTEQQETEKWMLGLRLARGVPLEWIQTDAQKIKFDTFLNKELIEIHPDAADRFRLTARGFALSDEMIGSFVKNDKN